MDNEDNIDDLSKEEYIEYIIEGEQNMKQMIYKQEDTEYNAYKNQDDANELNFTQDINQMHERN